jgi:aryl sulfotransferase
LTGVVGRCEGVLEQEDRFVERYRSFIFNNARWDGFALRPDDVIVTTPAKAGTTWLQAICVSLVLGPPPWYGSLAEISPWLDMNMEPLPDVHARLDAQEHRRVIKSHTPLDGLSESPGVRFICVGRDPRDVGLSWDGHLQNTDMANTFRARFAAVGTGDLEELGIDPTKPPPPAPEDPAERFRLFVQNEESALHGGSLLGFAHHIGQAWGARHRDDVLLLHYADLRADLAGEMRRIAAFLDIDVDEDRWPALVEAAGFDAMRARADEFVPAVSTKIWQNTEKFFAEGRLGGWRSLPAEVLECYDERADELFAPDLRHWLHRDSRSTIAP